jgi:hypothetical protein
LLHPLILEIFRHLQLVHEDIAPPGRALKIDYDIALFLNFRNIKPPEDEEQNRDKALG